MLIQTRMKWVALLLCVSALFAVGLAQSIPPKGLYAVLRNDLIQQMAQSLAISIADSANTDTNIPNYNGDSGKVSYTFSNFRFTLDLDGYHYSAQSPQYTFGWAQTGFVLRFNYHMCLHVILHPCESGWVQITTTKLVNLQVDSALDFSGPTVSFTAQNVELLFNRGDVDVFVQCTNAICVIPVSDIANAVASQFVPAFVGGIKQSINTAANQYINGHYPTSFTIPSLNLQLAMDGTYFEENGNLVLAFEGKLTPANGGLVPPFQPTISPPVSLFASPASQMTFILTDYLLDSGVWASIYVNNGFVRIITSADLPPSIPSILSLSTNNLLFLTAVQGMYSYLNHNMSVTLSIINATIDLGSPTIVNAVVETDFAILGVGSSPLPAFKLLIDMSFAESMTPPLVINNNLILNASVGAWKGQVLSGTNQLPGNSQIVLSYFQDALNTALPYIGTQILPTISLPLPTNFQLSQPTVTMGSGYSAFGVAVEFTHPEEQVCPGNTKVCPVGTTCCSNSGVWGCCPLGNAVCCGNGSCCPSGTSCANGMCRSSKGKKHYSVVPVHML